MADSLVDVAETEPDVADIADELADTHEQPAGLSVSCAAMWLGGSGRAAAGRGFHRKRAAASTNQARELCGNADKFGGVADMAVDVAETKGDVADMAHDLPYDLAQRLSALCECIKNVTGTLAIS